MSETTTAKVPARKKRVVVVAMKPQIRGRIRRNVMTFLEAGAEVVIVNSVPRDDFLVGLKHPDLHVEFLDPKSLSVRYTNWVTQQNRKRRAKWDAEKAAQVQRSSQLTRPERSTRRNCPVLERMTPLFTSRRAVRTGRSLLRIWRHTQRWLIRQGRSLRKQRDKRIRAFLHRFHRINRFLEFWRLSTQHVQKLSPDLVVSSDLPGLVGANLGARRLGRPHLHDCHELYLESTSFKGYEKRLLRPIEAWFMRRADSVVVVNETIRGEYRKRYGVEGVVLRNCGPAVPQTIRDHPVDLHGLLGLPLGAPIVLYQGGLAVGRGLDVLIAAAAKFPEGVHTVLVGSGQQREELGRQVEKLCLGDNVHFIPAVLPHELPAYTAAASVGVIPYQPVSTNNFMALPNKVFEYTGAGVPFVASDLPELRRIAEEAGCAEVYGPFDPHGLATAVTKILAAPDHETYRRAAATFGQHNTWESERLILISEAERIAPALTTGTDADPIRSGHGRASRTDDHNVEHQVSL